MIIDSSEVSCGVVQAMGINGDPAATERALQKELSVFMEVEAHPPVHVVMSNTSETFFNHLSRKYRGSIKVAGPTVNPSTGNKIWTAIFTIPKGFIKCPSCGK